MKRHRPKETPDEAQSVKCGLVSRPVGITCFPLPRPFQCRLSPHETIGRGEVPVSHLFSVCVWAPFQKPHGKSLWANIIKSDSLKCCYRWFGNRKCYLKELPVPPLPGAAGGSRGPGWTIPRYVDEEVTEPAASSGVTPRAPAWELGLPSHAGRMRFPVSVNREVRACSSWLVSAS